MSSLRLSHSSVGKYLTCGKSYELHYKKKIRSKYTGSALVFGKAFDTAVETSFAGGDTHASFLSAWQPFANNDSIQYFKSDLDLELLSLDDEKLLESNRPDSVSDIKEAVSLVNQAAFRKVSDKVQSYYNYACWLSLKAKGVLMIDAFQRDLRDKFKRVIATQKEINLEHPDGHSAVGYVDLIAELHDGSIVIVDLKTASRPYEEDSVKTSAQLALYSYALEDEIPHQYCAFAVVLKKPKKDYHKACEVCGAVNTSSHKTCNEKVDGARCGGNFIVTPSFYCETQFIMDVVPANTKTMVVENFNDISRAIEANIFPRNLSTCSDIFGKPCEFYNLCHNNSMEGLEEKQS